MMQPQHHHQVDTLIDWNWSRSHTNTTRSRGCEHGAGAEVVSCFVINSCVPPTRVRRPSTRVRLQRISRGRALDRDNTIRSCCVLCIIQYYYLLCIVFVFCIPLPCPPFLSAVFTRVTSIQLGRRLAANGTKRNGG